MINIGTGPSNARTITDHVAVLRPHAWLMLGYCAGLSNSQNLGDYVLAHGYVREDHVLDNELPLWMPIPALVEMQIALELAIGEVTGLAGSSKSASCELERSRASTTATGRSVTPVSSDVCRSRALSRSTWSRQQSPPTASASACRTAPYPASLISPSMVRSSSPVWPVNSIASVSGSVSRSG